MIALALKSTAAIAVALLFVVAARRSRASLRHLILAALFAFLLLLPLVQKFAPSVDISITQKTIATRVAAVAAPQIPAAAPATPQRSHSAPVRWNPFILYFAVTALLLAHLAVGILRLRRLAAHSEMWIEGTTRMAEIAQAAHIRRAALVVLSDEIESPLTFHATIVLPRAATQWSSAELTHALRHELEHVRRDDWTLQLVARAACALYWMHPLVWVAWRRFCLEAERACDDAVIGDCAPDAYATQLVALARNMQRMRAVPALAMASRSRLALRVESILDAKRVRGPHGRYAAAAVCVVLLALIVGLAPARFIEAVERPVTRAASRAPDDDVHAAVAEALVKAAEAGDADRVQRILDEGVNVNLVSPGDGTALIGAARGGQRDLVEYLLARGADPNLPSLGDGSPLIAAAEHGSVEIVTRLLDAGADIDRQVEGDENALMQAAWNGHIEIVRLLIARGADVNASSWERDELRTPLRLAKRGGHHDIVNMLRAAGARH